MPQGGILLRPGERGLARHGKEMYPDAFPKTKYGQRQGRRVDSDRGALCGRLCRLSSRPWRCPTVSRDLIQQWLGGMGLELKPSKTRIGHTLRKHDGQAGFDFLGFTIRQHPVGKYHTGKDTRGRPLGFKNPHQAQHGQGKAPTTRRLAAMVRRHRAAPEP